MDDPAVRRRLLYRATHRGTKELDWLVGRVLESRLADLDGPALAHWEALVAAPDPDLQDWIMGAGGAPSAELAGLVAEIRRFHGLA